MKPFDWTHVFIGPYKVYTHIAFWLMVSCAIIFLREYPDRMTGLTMICLVTQVTLELMISSYSQNLLVIPLFRRHGWLIGIVVYVVQVVLLICLLPYVLNGIGLLFPVSDQVDWRNEHISLTVITFTLMATAFRIALDSLILDKRQKENELRHLKAQLNPHFLFNTLNNLYGLSVAESKQLPGLMLKLSDLLRYSLYDTNQSYVPLQKELNYISNYIELERIRLSNKIDIQLSIPDNYSDQFIAPLLLIIFVENAFKHFSSKAGQQAYVHILLKLDDRCLELNIRNSVDVDYKATQGQNQVGIGLSNVKQRLNLIYAQQHVLKITDENGYFEVNLDIDLN